MTRPRFLLVLAWVLGCLGRPAVHAGEIDDRAALALAAEPSPPQRAHPKYRAFDLLRRTATEGCEAAVDAALLAEPPAPASPATEPAATDLFALPALVRLLYQFPQCVDDTARQAMLKALTAPQDRLGHGTINHAILRVASWYLLAQRFPQARWQVPNGQPMDSATLMSAASALMDRRTARFFADGHVEWLSPTYAGINLLPLLNLIDFAADAQVRAGAQAQAALLVSALRAASFHGTLLPPLDRLNHDQRNAPGDGSDTPAVTQLMLWLYFGEPSSGIEDLANRNEPAYFVIPALSGWRPPAALLHPAGSSGHSLQMRTPGFAIWDAASPMQLVGDSYIDDAYAIGAGNVVFTPNRYADHLQSFALLLKSQARRNAIECRHPYFQSDLGEDTWGTDRWSPFQQTHRVDAHTALMLFRIPVADPWPGDPASRFFGPRSGHARQLIAGVQCRVPRSVDHFAAEAQWLFVRHGEVDVAIGLPAGRFDIDADASAAGAEFHVAKVASRSAGLVFLVRKPSPGDSFESFKRWARARMPLFDETVTRLVHTTADGRKVSVQFKLETLPDGRVASLPEVQIDGRPAPAPAEAPLQSEPVNLAHGVLELVDASGRRSTFTPPRRATAP